MSTRVPPSVPTMPAMPASPASRANPAPNSADARLRKTSLQLEGVFVQRLFAAMRETVPDEGIVSQDGAQQMFSEMLDEKIAERAPGQWSGPHSIADALYRQLRQRLPGDAAAAAKAQDTTPSVPTTETIR